MRLRLSQPPAGIGLGLSLAMFMVIVILHQGSGNPHGPSWVMDPQMDPKIDPAGLILVDPCRLKALQGPSKVQIDQFLRARAPL